MKEIIGDQKLYVSFSGGLDSTVVALIARDVFPKSQITLVNVCFGAYSYSNGLEAVLLLAKQMGLRLFFVQGETEQENLMYHGPNCNQCTKNIKIGKVKEFVYKGIIASGANMSDSWGKTGIKFLDGMYSPLLNLEKPEIRAILDYYNFKIPKVGENSHREGCKFKHLLKMAVNNQYHSRADVISNEIIHDILDQYGYERDIANVKIIGPLSKNIALINIKPLPPKEITDKIIEVLKKESSIAETVLVDRPIKLDISANPGIVNNSDSKYWIKTGRLQPEFAFPIEINWIRSSNIKLWTFSVIGYSF
ncbi:MAG: ExsB family protein [Thermotogae bacterium]|nr:ExsB family protein [Thermotogota bacterium]